jgi:alginate O-acetyltransferase complex protein AlgI
MLFNSPVFLFIFLPLVLAGGILLRKTARNIFLLISSLVFYTWGEAALVAILIASICVNYFTGIGIDRFKDSKKRSHAILIIAVILNVLLLFYFKYFNFIIIHLKLSEAFQINPETGLVFPLGISFFTFQGISYIVDVYRRDAGAQKNLLLFGLYVSFFPQLISGPINRYPDISPQLVNRKITWEKFTEGMIRFIRGLAKKVIIANTAGIIANQVFGLNHQEMPTALAWLGIICYTLQIYYDFSGYSDMAIGLAKVFGFEFKENFNYPYVAKSIRGFWQQWHISLSSWLRDYLFSPISVKLRYSGSFGLITSVLVTFIICGIWHGPGWHFLIWGIFHALLLIFEQIKIVRFQKWPVFIRRFYVIFAVIIGWVFFRSETLTDALLYFKTMFGLASGHNYAPLIFVTNYSIIVLLTGILFAAPLRKKIGELINAQRSLIIVNSWNLGRYPIYLLLFFIAIAEMAQSGFNPFIYFRF